MVYIRAPLNLSHKKEPYLLNIETAYHGLLCSALINTYSPLVSLYLQIAPLMIIALCHVLTIIDDQIFVPLIYETISCHQHIKMDDGVIFYCLINESTELNESELQQFERWM